MKKLAFLLTLAIGSSAFANTISVQFTACPRDGRSVCALVYDDQTTGSNFKGTLMRVIYPDGEHNKYAGGLINPSTGVSDKTLIRGTVYGERKRDMTMRYELELKGFK